MTTWPGCAPAGKWPTEFSLAGVYPARWTPVDSLAIQGYLAQQLDYTTSPLDYAVLAGSLGIERTMRWLPVQPAGPQHPFDIGPYRSRRLAPAAAASVTAHQGGGRGAVRVSAGVSASRGPVSLPSAAVVRSAAAALAVTSRTPVGQAAFPPIGSAWAVNGAKVRGGGSMLAGTAGLPGFFPSGWFQVAITAPGFDVTGVSLPGVPGNHGRPQQAHRLDADQRAKPVRAVLRREDQPRTPRRLSLARSMAADAAGTLHDSGARRPDQEADGRVHEARPAGDRARAGRAWRCRSSGRAAAGRLMLRYWPGSARQSTSRSSTRHWVAGIPPRRPSSMPIAAAISARLPPAISRSLRTGLPGCPCRALDLSDVTGLIPYAALPLSYNPSGHVVAAAGQQPVSAAYPYYLGTSANDLDAGDSAGAAYTVLGRRSQMSPDGVVALQTSPVSELAAQVVPRLLAALRHARLSAAERQAMSVLRGWNHQMAPASAAAAIWSAFWPDYLSATFGPWWRAARVPVAADPAGLSDIGSSDRFGASACALDACRPVEPGVRAARCSRQDRGISHADRFRRCRCRAHSPVPWRPVRAGGWTGRAPDPFVSSAQLPVLGYGARAAATSSWLADQQVAGSALPASVSAVGGASPGVGAASPSVGGPGWRMIVRLSPGRRGIMAEGIYPGGQSDNPASAWHDNLTARWQNGGYLLLPSAGTPVTGSMRWEFVP